MRGALAVSTTRACQRDCANLKLFSLIVKMFFSYFLRLWGVAKEGGRHPGRPRAGVAAGRGNPGQEGGGQGGGANERVSGEASSSPLLLLLSTFPPLLLLMSGVSFLFFIFLHRPPSVCVCLPHVFVSVCDTSSRSADNRPLACARGYCRRDSGHVIYTPDASFALGFVFFKYASKGSWAALCAKTAHCNFLVHWCLSAVGGAVSPEDSWTANQSALWVTGAPPTEYEAIR